MRDFSWPQLGILFIGRTGQLFVEGLSEWLMDLGEGMNGGQGDVDGLRGRPTPGTLLLWSDLRQYPLLGTLRAPTDLIAKRSEFLLLLISFSSKSTVSCGSVRSARPIFQMEELHLGMGKRLVQVTQPPAKSPCSCHLRAPVQITAVLPFALPSPVR